MRAIIRQVILPSLCLVGAILFLEGLGMQHWLHPQRWLMLGFFATLTFAQVRITEFGLSQEQTKFQNFYFAAMIIRLFGSLLLLLGLLIYETENKATLAGNFLIFYLFYFVFEIYYLLGNLRVNSKL